MSSVAVTICPPAPAHIMLGAESQFCRSAQPVAVHFIAGGECVGTGIAFDDYQNMQTRARGNYKRRAAPAWSDKELQEILCALLEHRACIHEVPKGLTRLQRIDAAHQRLLTRRAGLLRALDDHVQRYMELRAAGLPTKNVESKIEMYDAQLEMLPRLPAILCAVIYLSYRLGFTSPQVAHSLKCSPVFVRQVLSRARTTAGKIERGESASHSTDIV
jgi:DNA-directed RNA polymerase specialized sigma24 family protein